MSHGTGRSNVPDKKVQAGGAAAAATVLVVFIAGQFGLEVPPEAAAAFTTLLGFVAAYFTKGDA